MLYKNRSWEIESGFFIGDKELNQPSTSIIAAISAYCMPEPGESVVDLRLRYKGVYSVSS